jgi:hypothetical protein
MQDQSTGTNSRIRDNREAGVFLDYLGGHTEVWPIRGRTRSTRSLSRTSIG